MCVPLNGEGLGFRSLFDINRALIAKLWWNLRTNIGTLWSTYMGYKYGKKMHPTFANSRGASQVWRSMTQIREEIEPFIWWQLKCGNSSFWFDNWTRCGAIYYLEGDLAQEEEIEVSYFYSFSSWNETLLRESVSIKIANFITNEIKPGRTDELDRPWWLIASDGRFSVKTSFDFLRKRAREVEWSKKIWLKGLPCNMSFFLWRIFKRRIPTDDVLKTIGISIASRCACCNIGVEETLHHLFLTAPIAQMLWRHFATCAGIRVAGRNIHNTVREWWKHTATLKANGILNAIPAIIIWE